HERTAPAPYPRQRCRARRLPLRHAGSALRPHCPHQHPEGGLMTGKDAKIIQMIPIALITIVNARVRNKRSFAEMAENIREVGLKKPVTVARREGPEGVRY